MITLYREITTYSTERVQVYTNPNTGNPIYDNLPVLKKVARPIKFPDNIFTYEGWTCDYVSQKAYRWKGTEKEQVFYLDASLIGDTSGYVSPQEWMATKGNYIKSELFESCLFCDNEIKSAQNPSGNPDNIWLLSYRKADDSEAYLYQYTYDNRDNILVQRSEEPRANLQLPPGPGNVLGETTDINEDYLNELIAADDATIIDPSDPENGGYQGDDGTTITDPDNTGDQNTGDPDNTDPNTGDPEDTDPNVEGGD